MLVPVLLALALAAQAPTVGDVEVFGARKLSSDKIMKTLGVKPGDPLPPSKNKLEEGLMAIDGVARASVEAFCCDAGQAILYVGIEERGASAYPLRDWPQGDLQLPEEIPQSYHDFALALAQAVREGDTAEDLSAGHSLMKNVACHVLQERFVGLAELYTEVLRSVLREADDEEQRAIAAYVLGYAPNKREIVDDLQQALRDPDPDVRANALRAIKPIALLAQQDKELGIKFETTWLVEMLNSTVLKDRLEAVDALLELTENGVSPSTEKHIRERGLHGLTEMAHWRHLPHALPAYMLMGRLAGMTEEELANGWVGDQREKKLQAIEQKLKSKK